MAVFEDFFSVQVFLIVLREALETAVIISVLLAFIHKSFISKKTTKKENASNDQYHGSTNQPHDTLEVETTVKVDELAIYKYLRLQIWVGGLLGLVCCLVLGSAILAVFYVAGSDLWAVTEHYWEGAFSILASIIISVMGVKILRVNKMQQKWKTKLAAIIHKSDYLNKAIRQTKNRRSITEGFSVWSEKYSMFILPFVTTLREGMEAIVFIGGIGINEDTSIVAIVNSTVLAIILGAAIGILLYRSGNTLSLQWFLIVSTSFLYIVAAGLFSKGVWNFELQRFIDNCDGFDVSETGHGPGSYDIATSVWHVNCCNGEIQEDGAFWMVATAIFGWTNSATYGSVISYNLYWIVVIAAFSSLVYEEKHGRLPVIPLSWQQKRIAKRRFAYEPLSAPEVDVVQNVRQSIDSVNSTTPLT